MAGRVQVWPTFDDDGERIWRLHEQTGERVISWAPGIENPDPDGVLDRGGFRERSDAKAFALGIDRWRAEVALIPMSVAAVDAERHALDVGKPRRTLDQVAGAAVRRLDAPEVIYRRTG
jgi:hypothetical protein